MPASSRNIVPPVLSYGILFVATNFVNKYVLSVLDFKYPTLFQGWQTLVGFLLLRVLVVSKHLQPMLTESSRSDIIRWVPGMVLFAASVYSGSKGLANLPIPSFFALQNLSSVIAYGFHVIKNQMMVVYRLPHKYFELTSFFSYLMMMMVVASSVMIIHTDPQFHPEGYIWTGIHILVTGLLQIYSKLTKGRLKANSVEKLYCNYIYSVIIFAPSSYLLGDALEAISFPYLYFSKFWIGCILSGVFGVFLNLQAIEIQEKDISFIDFSKLTGCAKIVTSVLSFFFFESFYTANYAMWITVNLLTSLVVEDPDQINGKAQTISVEEISGDQALMSAQKATGMDLNNRSTPQSSRHNVLYNDYLRDPESSDTEDSEVSEINKYHV